MPRLEQQDGDSDSEDRGLSRKEIYERALSMLDYQTSPEQRPSCARNHLMMSVGHSNLPKAGVETALRAARENGDVIRWRGRDGTFRFCLTADEKLRRLAAYEAEQDYPNRALIAEANQRRKDTWESRRADQRGDTDE